MAEAKEAIKDAFKKAFSPKYRKRVIQALVVVVFFLLLLAAAVYFITVDDGTYKEDDWGNTPYGASQYIGGISVEKDGTLKSGTTAQELWDKMLKNKSRVDEYLSNPEELARLMRAEITTQYPDTRPNPDEEIKWDEVVKNPDLMQGIIKFKRANSEGNRSTMSYVDPETFQGYIDEYNNSGSETAKQNALNHFTLKKVGGQSSSAEGVNYNGPELYWPTDGTYITSYFGPRNAPIAGASTNHGAIDIGVGTGTNVYACEKGTVTFAAMAGNAGNLVTIDHGNGYITKYMHNSIFQVNVGDTVEKGQVIALSGNTGNSTGPHVHFQIEYNGTKLDPLDFKYHNGMGNGAGGFGVDDEDNEDKKKDDKKDKDKKDKDKKDDDKKKDDKEDKKESIQKAVSTPAQGDGYQEIYTSSAGISYKHYKQFQGSYKDNSYWSGTIHSSGCGPTSVAILASGLVSTDYEPGKIAAEMNTVYGYTSYITLQGEMNSLGMESEVIQSPSAETIQEKLKDGKVMLVSVDGNTIFTSNSHIMALVDINEQGQVYLCNPGSSSLHGWYDIGEIMKGCQYIVVTDGKKGKTVAPSKNTSNYIAVVATWKQIDTTVTSDDPGVNVRTNSPQYSMTTTNVNYEEMVAPYTMPFDLLWALLVVGEDKDFIFELADLIYHSDIQITIHDNLTTNTDIDEWHYTLKTKAEVAARIKATCKGNSAIVTLSDDVHDPYLEKPYTTTKKVVTKTNTLVAAVTKADVWIVDYENEYIYLGSSEGEGSKNKATVKSQDYPHEPDRIEYTYSCEHLDEKREEAKSKAIAAAMKKDVSQGKQEGMEANEYPVNLEEAISAKYYSKYVNMYDNISHGTSLKRYVQGSPRLTEKVDKETAPNFVTIFNKGKYRKNKINIKDANEWLFEIIETNDSTADMWPDLIRYLLYKATGNKYDGVDKFDFSVFKPGSFKKIGGGGNLDIKALTETNLLEEEFVALVQGYSAAISKGAGTADFRNNASTIYQVCVENHINPVFCAAQAWREQNWDDPNTSPYNYWGIAVYNGQNYGSSWPDMASAVQAYCDQVNSQATMTLYMQRAQEYAALDSRFKGDMSTIYDVFSAYCYKGDQYSRAENAKYVGDYIDSLSTIAQQIFGVGLE